MAGELEYRQPSVLSTSSDNTGQDGAQRQAARPIPNPKQCPGSLYNLENLQRQSMHLILNVLISRSAKFVLARCQRPLPSISAFISCFVVAIPFVIATRLSIEKVSFGVDFLSRPEVVDAEDDCVASTLHERDLLFVFSLLL